MAKRLMNQITMNQRTLQEEYYSWGMVFGIDVICRPEETFDDIPQEVLTQILPIVTTLMAELQRYHKVCEDNCNFGVSERRQETSKERMLTAGRAAGWAMYGVLSSRFLDWEFEYTPDKIQYITQSDPRGWPLIVLAPGKPNTGSGFRPLLRERNY